MPKTGVLCQSEMLPHSCKKKFLLLLLLLICFVAAMVLRLSTASPDVVGPTRILGKGESGGHPVVIQQAVSEHKHTFSCFPNEPNMTAWGAPIVWHGNFNRTRDDELHRARGTVIGLSVFAVGKYVQRYLRHFLETAELYFMAGYPVVYYVMADNISMVSKIHLAPNRSMVPIKVQKHIRWQDISMMRMRDIAELVVPRAKWEVNFLFCMDVDQEFTSHYGVETLSDLVAQIHSYHYLRPKFEQEFETNPESAAFVEPSKSDYYYHAATFGGTVPEIQKLTMTCLKGIWKDKEKGIEAIWHEESHLNHYLLHTKPTKLLSPEYNWDGQLNVKYHTLRWMPKDYKNLREHPI